MNFNSKLKLRLRLRLRLRLNFQRLISRAVFELGKRWIQIWNQHWKLSRAAWQNDCLIQRAKYGKKKIHSNFSNFLLIQSSCIESKYVGHTWLSLHGRVEHALTNINRAILNRPQFKGPNMGINRYIYTFRIFYQSNRVVLSLSMLVILDSRSMEE